MVRERKKPATREITIEITGPQKVEMAEKAGELRSQKAMIQEEFARTKSAFKGRIEAKESEISKLLEAIHSGSYTKEAEVVEVFDFETGQVEIEHDGAVITVRNMTGEERQMGLRMPEKKQGELALTDEPKASQSPVQAGGLDPWVVQLPICDEAAQPVHVPGESDRPTVVKYLATTWRQEAGEGATYEVVTEDVFGTPTKCWRRAALFGVAPAPTAEETPTTEEQPQ